jgi:hypothetical protein
MIRAGVLMRDRQAAGGQTRQAWWLAAAVLAGLLLSAPAVRAQDPNPGAITLTGGLDLPSVYVFRGFVQERNPKLTLFPYADIGVALKSGTGTIKSIALDLGLWNSLQTGSSRLHYEEDFYSTLSFGLAHGLTASATFTARTSPNAMFNTVKEVSVKLSKTGWFNPYGFVGFEVGEWGADGSDADLGGGQGRYLELGAAPAFHLFSKATLAVPVKIGVSLKDYYQLGSKDNRFGFADVGAQITVPMTSATSRFGQWNVHGGVDVLALGTTTKSYNEGKSSKVVGLLGVGVTY